MKKIIIVTLIIAAAVFSSCDEDSPTSGNDPGIVAGYDPSESSQCMTLASISYVNENNTAYLRDSLIIQLADTNYATQGKWKLSWGPALSSDGSNLMFVVKDTTSGQTKYAIVIRGTDWCFPFNWKEDLGAIEFCKYPYGSAGDSISCGALAGLNTLLALRDSATNVNLLNYIISISLSTKQQMFITGHSLGGMLATVLSAWFLDNGLGSNFYLKTYTFAAPSSGNQQFVDHYTQIFSSAGAESHRVVNPKDLVHYFNGDINEVLANNIPTTIPLKAGLVLIGINTYFQTYNMIYRHVGQRFALGTKNPTDCNFAPGSLDQYECWVAFEHTTNTYLTLLGAPITNISEVPCDWER